MTLSYLPLYLPKAPSKGLLTARVIEQGAADMLPYFAEVASTERVNLRRGVLWGLFLGFCLWIGIFGVFWLVKP
jgi:hypothetical protein